MKMLLLCALRGSIILYQGEELGLSQVDVPFDRLQDPEAIANWPHTLGRDGARTPMPWAADAPYLGFSSSEPWLPAGDDHRALAVDRQEADAASLLQFTRECLRLRNAHPALRHGGITMVEAREHVVAFERRHEGERLRCTFNLSDQAAAAPIVGTPTVQVGEINGGALGPYAAIIETVA